MTNTNPWIKCVLPRNDADVRLFCFPYAGIGASIYGSWPELFPEEIEIRQIQLPGRGSRVSEPPITDLDKAVKLVEENLLPYLDRPFAFLGYSMGALLAFELARALQSHGQSMPNCLILAARQAPHIPQSLPHLHRMTDEDLIEELGRRYRRLPLVILNEPEFLAMVLRTIRADFTLLECYVPKQVERLICPITVVGGIDDSVVSTDNLVEWNRYTRNSFDHYLLPGGHFFLETQKREFIRLITKILRNRI